MGRIVGLAAAAACMLSLVLGTAAHAVVPLEDHVFYVWEETNPSINPPNEIHGMAVDHSSYETVFDSDPNGWEGADDLAVSPDGRTIFYKGTWSDHTTTYGAIVAVNTDGTDHHVVMDGNLDDAHWRFMEFAPDGQRVLINRLDSNTWDDDIYTIDRNTRSADEASPTPLIDWPGDQYDGTFTPNGQKLLFTSGSTESGDPLDGYTLHIADADGSDAEIVDGMSGFVDVWGVAVSPNGQRILFGALDDWSSNYDLYSIDLDGTDLVQVTDTAEDEHDPAWSPDGDKVIYERNNLVYAADPDGTDEDSIAGKAWSPAVRQPSTLVGPGDIQAAKFRPKLQFDGTENWRPLNVDLFMAERDPSAPNDAFHKLCDPSGCSSWPLFQASDVEDWEGWLDIGSIGGQAPSNFYSPRGGCALNGLRDCDGDEMSTPDYNTSAFYYHAVDSPGAYRYLDYWTFYRYNDLSVDEHEGDWEGLTVVPSLTDPDAIDAVAMAQHTDTIWYLPGSLACDAGGAGSCEPGTRPWAYVASGSHASYASHCENDLVAMPPQVCLTPADLPEGDHQGDAPWGRNDHDPYSGALIEFPPAGDGQWVNWPGRWGSSCEPYFQCTFPPPNSPGGQSRFNCPWDGFEQESCPGNSALRSAPGAAGPGGELDRSASECGSWFGADAVATACSPSRLARAIAEGALGHEGRLQLARDGERAPSARGIAQLLGKPLRAGETLRLTGSTPDARLLVRAQVGRRLYRAVFDDLHSADVTVRAGGPAGVRARAADGGALEPTALTVSRIEPVGRGFKLVPEPTNP